MKRRRAHGLNDYLNKRLKILNLARLDMPNLEQSVAENNYINVKPLIACLNMEIEDAGGPLFLRNSVFKKIMMPAMLQPEVLREYRTREVLGQLYPWAEQTLGKQLQALMDIHMKSGEAFQVDLHRVPLGGILLRNLRPYIPTPTAARENNLIVLPAPLPLAA